MFSKDVYAKRRRELASRIKSGVLLFLGNSEAGINYIGNTYRFRQDSTFLYFFGLDEPDLSAVIDIDSGEEIIFGNDVTIETNPSDQSYLAKGGKTTKISKKYKDSIDEFMGA